MSKIKNASEAQRGDENEVFIDYRARRSRAKVKMKRSFIDSIKAREILDSRGMPTIEVELETNLGKFLASVPSGVSTGKYEAVELRDKDGRGVKKAIENIERVIAPVLVKEDKSSSQPFAAARVSKEDTTCQKRLDDILIKLDGTKNKSRLGANAILAVSMAICRAGAAAKDIPLYQHIAEIYLSSTSIINLPKASFNMIEGGKHARSTGSGQAGLAFQEFMIIPQKDVFKENLEIGIKIYRKLRDILEEKFGKENIELSEESAFSAPIKEISQAFDLIMEAAEKTGYKNDIKIAIDAAASSFFGENGYKINDKILTKEKLIDFYQNIIEKYPIISFEDPFEEEDFMGFPEVIEKIGEKIIIFGDDLLASNVERIKMAYEKGAYNGLILKPNQIGTVTETLEAAKLAKSFGWKIMVANRAGETEDDFIADLAVGVGAEFIKSGAPFAKERMAKYNRLLRIEEKIYSGS